MKAFALRAIKYAQDNREAVDRIVNFFFSYALYLAVSIFGAMYALMIVGVDAEKAMLIINYNIYGLALFTAVFLMLILGFSWIVEKIGKL